jgi:maleate isomerase
MPDSAQAVVVGGNGLRSVGVIAALEEDLGRPVVTANQVLLWGMLRAIRSRVSPRGYGQLFTLDE